ncbi:olfactory receptor 7E24-like, partial [Dipodomys merriami]|uniref:olfactory receptor 7E24-like n=1 Tax=Dipodomys merriami TaxID=94247 RepID=UPI0038559A29
FLKRCPSKIESQNGTHVSEFHLLGLSENPDLQPCLFGLFLSMYLITVFGNLVIILAICSDPPLHTPMYFFLSVLSFVDICFISTTVPNLIVNIWLHSWVITHAGCLTQMSIYILFATMDDMLLTVMAYDRFVAICHPLHYSVLMSPHLCRFLVCTCLSVSIVNSQLHTLFVLQFTNFQEVQVANFFCDPSHVVNLVCSNTFSKDMVKYFAVGIFGFFPVVAITLSYYKIIASILKIASSSGRYKAFSTCGSHLSAVSLFYGTSIGVYLGSGITESPRKVVVASVVYTVINPMLNPFIYSLRNRDMKQAFNRIHRRKFFFRT